MGNFEIHESLRDLRLDKNIVRLVAFQEKALIYHSFETIAKLNKLGTKVIFKSFILCLGVALNSLNLISLFKCVQKHINIFQ